VFSKKQRRSAGKRKKQKEKALEINAEALRVKEGRSEEKLTILRGDGNPEPDCIVQAL
jgi:hypothetical protein